MPKLEFLDLSTKLTGFGKLVRANHGKCDTRFARVVHDRLADALESLATSCKKGERAERLLETETDPAAREMLEDALNNCVADLETGGGGFYPWHLLDRVDCDPDFGGYHDPISGMRCSGSIPQSLTVSDAHLCGLIGIMERIAADTGIRFTAYLCYDCIGPEGAGDLDPEIYERPLDNIRYL